MMVGGGICTAICASGSFGQLEWVCVFWSVSLNMWSGATWVWSHMTDVTASTTNYASRWRSLVYDSGSLHRRYTMIAISPWLENDMQVSIDWPLCHRTVSTRLDSTRQDVNRCRSLIGQKESWLVRRWDAVVSWTINNLSQKKHS